MICYTGDTHGSAFEITRFCHQYSLTRDDVIVILGDVGANYYSGKRDEKMKGALNHLKPAILCVYDNHEMRPYTIPSYKSREWNGSTVWYEEQYPKLLLAKDGEISSVIWLLAEPSAWIKFC